MSAALLLCIAAGGAAFAREKVNVSTKISDVVNNPAFGNYGRMIFPLDEYYYSGKTLGDLRLTWYSCINPSRTADVINHMLD